MFWVSHNFCFILTTQSATKHITINGTSIEIHIRRLCRIKHQCIQRAACTGITQCRTAIDITVDDSCTSMARITYIQ